MPPCTDGCILFTRRSRLNSLYMHRGWVDYKAGFGDLDADYWMGLEDAHQATKDDGYSLRIYMASGDWCTYADYDTFIIGSEAENYKLTFDGYDPDSTEDHGDRMTVSGMNNLPFSTHDRDNRPNQSGTSCLPQGNFGGWWYNGGCATSTALATIDSDHATIGRWYTIRNYMEWRLIPK